MVTKSKLRQQDFLGSVHCRHTLSIAPLNVPTLLFSISKKNQNTAHQNPLEEIPPSRNVPLATFCLTNKSLTYAHCERKMCRQSSPLLQSRFGRVNLELRGNKLITVLLNVFACYSLVFIFCKLSVYIIIIFSS